MRLPTRIWEENGTFYEDETSLSCGNHGTHPREDVLCFVECGHPGPVECPHEGEAGTVGLDLGGDGTEKSGKHGGVREGGGGGSVGQLGRVIKDTRGQRGHS